MLAGHEVFVLGKELRMTCLLRMECLLVIRYLRFFFK